MKIVVKNIIPDLIIKNYFKRIILFSLIELIFASCNTGGHKGLLLVKKDGYISVSDNFGQIGGQLELPDGTNLNIPKNALKANTLVTLSIKDEETAFGETNTKFIKIEPEGLQYLSTSILEIPYKNTDYINESVITAYSNRNGIHERVKRINQDSQTKVISLNINYSSWIILQASDKMYPVVDIPGKYLMKTDLLYCFKLFNNSKDSYSNFPSSVAIYLGTNNPDAFENDCSTIIESSSPNGVVFSDMKSFKNDRSNLYLGARRNVVNPDSLQRKTIASFAINQLGACYKPIGWSDLQGCFNPGTLTEQAYEAAGINIVPSINEIPFLLPMEQFNRTVPVSEISVEVGDTIEIPCYTLVWRPKEEAFTKDERLYSIEATNLPDGSTFLNNTFKWIPPANYLDKEVGLNFFFSIQGDKRPLSKNQILKIHIIPHQDITIPQEISDFFYQKGWQNPCVSGNNSPQIIKKLDLNGDRIEDYLLFFLGCPESEGKGSLYIFDGTAPYPCYAELRGKDLNINSSTQILRYSANESSFYNILIGDNCNLIFDNITKSYNAGN